MACNRSEVLEPKIPKALEYPARYISGLTHEGNLDVTQVSASGPLEGTIARGRPPNWLQEIIETLPPNLTAFSLVSEISAKKRKAIEHSTDPPAAKAGRKDDESSTHAHPPTGPQYDGDWYLSPLDDPNVGSRKNYREKRMALRSLESAKHRIDHDIAKVAGFLTQAGHLDSQSEDENDSDAENVFADFELMKVGKWGEQEEDDDQEPDEEEDEEGDDEDKEESE